MPNNRAGTRSRRPQGIFDGVALPQIDTDNDGIADATDKQTPVPDVVVVAAADLLANAALSSTTAGENGYSTQNQRYLHVYVEQGDADNVSLDLWSYNYAFGAWAEVQVFVGDGSIGGINLITSGAGGDRRLYVFEISGVDRVAFVDASAGSTWNPVDGDVIKVAVSSF